MVVMLVMLAVSQLGLLIMLALRASTFCHVIIVVVPGGKQSPRHLHRVLNISLILTLNLTIGD